MSPAPPRSGLTPLELTRENPKTGQCRVEKACSGVGISGAVQGGRFKDHNRDEF